MLSILYDNNYYDEKEFVVKGTNPPKAWVLAELNPIMQKIACVESRFRNFEARGDGGIGFPLIGTNDEGKRIGGIGIMQIYHPRPKNRPPQKELAPKAIWNWRENILAGKLIFNEKESEAKQLHKNERERLNNERMEKGLPMCPEGIPTPLNDEQLKRETLRRYNCGAEYRWEPRDAKDCKGEWVIDPSCIRKNKPGHDPDYVNKALNCKI